MAQQHPPDNNVEPKNGVGGAIGGAGAGTLLVLLANNLSNEHWYKSWLVIAAPTVAVIINGILNFIKRQIELWWEQWKAEAPLRQARKTLQAKITHRDTPPDEKAKYQQDLDELERLRVAKSVNMAKAYLEQQAIPTNASVEEGVVDGRR